MNRRGFVTAFAAAGLVRGQTNPIRAAVIGTSHGHAMSKIRALRSMSEFELVGVSRPDPSEPPPADARTIFLDEVLSDETIEMVAVETADVNRNLDLAEQFVRAGRFVHLDKPPGADLKRLRMLLDEAARRQRVVQMGYQWRFHPAMQAAIEAARKGWLGRIYRFRASIDKLVSPEERRHLARFRGGLMFSEGCHLIDRAVAVLGKPSKVTGFLRHESTIDDGLADNTLAVLEYDRALAEVSLAGFHDHGSRYRFLEVQGTNGFARVQPYSFPSRLTIDLSDAAGPYSAGAQTIEVQSPGGPTYSPDFREMAAMIRKGEKPSHWPEHDLATHETLLRVCGMLS